MTDNEIIKALECCVSSTTSEACDGCPLNTKEGCETHSYLLGSLALDLINRQRAEIAKWQSGYMTQKQEIANLEIEFKAMRGAANSFKAEIKKLQEAEAKRIQETAAPLVIRNNKIPAQELAKMIKNGVISTDIEDADIEIMTQTLKTMSNIVKATRHEAYKVFADRVIDLIYDADDVNPVSEQQIRNLVKEMAGENNDRN